MLQTSMDAATLTDMTSEHATDEPVVVEITVEAHPTTGTAEWTRAEWNAMTPARRLAAIETAVADEVGNAGGAGWHITSGATSDDVATSRKGLYAEAITTWLTANTAAVHTAAILAADPDALHDHLAGMADAIADVVYAI